MTTILLLAIALVFLWLGWKALIEIGQGGWWLLRWAAWKTWPRKKPQKTLFQALLRVQRMKEAQGRKATYIHLKPENQLRVMLEWADFSSTTATNSMICGMTILDSRDAADAKWN